MDTIVHFDIGADKLERAKKFYETLLGWKIGTMPGFLNYYEIETTDLNSLRSVSAGLTKRDNPKQNGITNFIGVTSIDDTVSKLNEHGGRVIQAKQSIPGYGYTALCLDTENNLFGLFQDDKQAK